jgi:hypothetical protein
MKGVDKTKLKAIFVFVNAAMQQNENESMESNTTI